MISAASSTTSHGNAARMTFVTGSCEMPDVTNRFSPTGGVIMPISMLTVMMMPRCTGWMPSAVAIGNMIGAKISTTDVASMKLPATSSSRFSTIRNAPRRQAQDP